MAAACAAEGLPGVRTVYLMRMANGFDQYLANRLTNMHVFEVVADPKKADAIFTDRLGEAFESRLDELYPPPKPPAAETGDDTETKDKDQEGDKDTDKDKNKDSSKTATEPAHAVSSGFGRGKGTVFLVDAKSRHVLWSLYEKPKGIAPEQWDRTASRLVEKLKKDLTGK